MRRLAPLLLVAAIAAAGCRESQPAPTRVPVSHGRDDGDSPGGSEAVSKPPRAIATH